MPKVKVKGPALLGFPQYNFVLIFNVNFLTNEFFFLISAFIEHSYPSIPYDLISLAAWLVKCPPNM